MAVMVAARLEPSSLALWVVDPRAVHLDPVGMQIYVLTRPLARHQETQEPHVSGHDETIMPV
jgi:hypothetical protein